MDPEKNEDPRTLAQERLLERCQRVAMAAIVGYWMPLYTEQLAQLGLEKLVKRYAESTTTRSCHKDIFKPATTNPARTGKTTLKYWESLARTATYYKSAAPYLTRLLNSH